MCKDISIYVYPPNSVHTLDYAIVVCRLGQKWYIKCRS